MGNNSNKNNNNIMKTLCLGNSIESLLMVLCGGYHDLEWNVL